MYLTFQLNFVVCSRKVKLQCVTYQYNNSMLLFFVFVHSWKYNILVFPDIFQHCMFNYYVNILIMIKMN
jgi:hypothetical protein